MDEIEKGRNSLYKIGGFSFVIIGIWYSLSTFWSYIFGIPSPGFSTPPVATEQQYFNVLAMYPTISTIFYSMYSFTCFLTIPAIFALYSILKGKNKNAMIIAVGFVALWIVIDLGVTEFNSLTLIRLAHGYNTTTDTSQKAAYFAAAEYSLNALPIATFYSYSVGSFGFLIASFVMRKSTFRRGTALPGIASNALGIVAAFVLFTPELSMLLLPTLNLYALWNIIVGIQLIKFSRKKIIIPITEKITLEH